MVGIMPAWMQHSAKYPLLVGNLDPNWKFTSFPVISHHCNLATLVHAWWEVAVALTEVTERAWVLFWCSLGQLHVCVLPVLRFRLLQLLIYECLFFQMILILPKQYSLSTATLGHVPSCSHNICWRLQAAVHTFFSPFFRAYLRCTYKPYKWARRDPCLWSMMSHWCTAWSCSSTSMDGKLAVWKFFYLFIF